MVKMKNIKPTLLYGSDYKEIDCEIEKGKRSNWSNGCKRKFTDLRLRSIDKYEVKIHLASKLEMIDGVVQTRKETIASF